nr:uncharacterized protein LOC106688268 [Halyomorpha halys]
MTTITYSMVKEDYDHIPTYDGNPEDLIFFVKTVKAVYDTVCSDNNTCKLQNHARLLSKVTSRGFKKFNHLISLVGGFLQDLDRSTITKMKDEFSVYFSVGWLQLMETDKITMNSNAQIFMLKLATSFNVLKLFKKTLAKMIDWCLNTFCRSHNKEVLDECLSCINYLNSFNKNIEIERSLISQVVTEFIEILNSENEETKILHLSYYKVLLLVKIYEDSCGNLWRSLVSSLEKERDLEKKVPSLIKGLSGSEICL